MQSAASRIPERIVLRVDPTKKAAFLEMLKLFDFVEVESLQNQVKRYVKNSPTDVPLSDNDIMSQLPPAKARGLSLKRKAPRP